MKSERLVNTNKCLRLPYQHKIVDGQTPDIIACLFRLIHISHRTANMREQERAISEKYLNVDGSPLEKTFEAEEETFEK